MTADILTARQIRVLGQIHWIGDVERTYVRIYDSMERDHYLEERRYRREIRRLTKRGYLAHGRLSRKGQGVVNSDWWNAPRKILRENIMESKS